MPRYISANEIITASDLRVLAHEIRLAYFNFKQLESEIPKRSLILKDSPFSAFVAMPAYSENYGIFLTKIGTVVPSFQGPSVRALIVVYSTKTNQPAILFDGIEITNLKCAAVTGFTTDICAGEHAKVLTLIGSGVQARNQLLGVSSVRTLKQIRVYSRDSKNIEKFISQNKAITKDAQFISCGSIKEALAGAEIISTATTSIDPLLFSEDLSSHNIHINCMGAHTPHSSELSPEIIMNAQLIVEDLNMAIAEAGSMHKDAMTLSDLVHYDACALKRGTTIFRSTGHAFLDLLTVVHVMKRLGLSVDN